MNRSHVSIILAVSLVIETIIIGFLFLKLNTNPPTGGNVNVDTKYIDLPKFELDRGEGVNQYTLSSNISLDQSYYAHFVETNTIDEISTLYNNYYKLVIFFGSGNPIEFSDNFQFIDWNISLFNNSMDVEFKLNGNDLPDDKKEAFDLILDASQQFEYMKILIYDSQNKLIHTLNTYAEDVN